ncbi:MAG: hypothetical protein OXI29_15950 [bacterium]|nr:hypothetical protein [bacterium]
MSIPTPNEPGHRRPVVPRVAVVAPYWDFWEPTVGPALRTGRESLLSAVADQLGELDVEVVWQGLVDSTERGLSMGAEVAGLGPDAVLVVQTMAVPPAYVQAMLDQLPQPVVIWALQDSTTISSEFDASHITSLGATVGTPMLTNLLHRTSRPFDLVLSSTGNSTAGASVADRLRAGAVAHRLQGARLARVGHPMDGYVCVDADDDELQRALGMQVVRISPQEVRDRYQAVIDDEVEARRQDVDRHFAVGADIHQPGQRKEDLSRTLRLAVAMETLDRDNAIAAGAMNCHVPEIRFGEEPGLTPCFGLGCETTRGIPWSCTGDVLTAVAMLVAKGLSGAALYHEVEAIDFDTGEVAIANSGEHDLGWTIEGQTPGFEPNPWFAHDRRTGFRVRFELPAGPASLVGFAHQPGHPSGFGLVVAEGEITGRELAKNPTAGGIFRFTTSPVTEAWTRWASAGVNHHSAIAPGHLAHSVATVAKFAGVDCVVI